MTMTDTQQAARQAKLEAARAKGQAKRSDPKERMKAIVGLAVALPLVLLGYSYCMNYEPADTTSSTDSCTQTYINDTAALARCYVVDGVPGLTDDDAVRVERLSGR